MARTCLTYGASIEHKKANAKYCNPSDDDPTDDAYHGTHYDDTCCKGLATIPYDMLDLWQPIPVGNASLEECLQPEAPGRERQQHGQGRWRTRP